MTSLKVICGGLGIRGCIRREVNERVQCAGSGGGFGGRWVGLPEPGWVHVKWFLWRKVTVWLSYWSSPLNTSTHKLHLCACSHTYLSVQTETPSYTEARIYTKSTHAHTHTHTHTHVGFYGLRGLSIGGMVFILYKLYVLLPYTYPAPKLSPHRRLCISIFPQKNSLCMIYKRFILWGHWKCPHKSPSPCNTYVIPMSLYKCVSS